MARSSPRCRRRSCCWRCRRRGSLGAYSAYATLALGSALALFLYPHAMTGMLSAPSARVIRRNAALLPAYSLVLGLLALLGFMAIAAGVKNMPQFADGLQALRQQLRGAGADPGSVPGLVRRCRLRRHRHRRAGAGRDHVDRRGQYVHPQHLFGRSSIPTARRRRKAQIAKMRLAGGQGRRADLHLLRCRCNTPCSCSCWAASGSSRPFRR